MRVCPVVYAREGEPPGCSAFGPRSEGTPEAPVLVPLGAPITATLHAVDASYYRATGLAPGARYEIVHGPLSGVIDAFQTQAAFTGPSICDGACKVVAQGDTFDILSTPSPFTPPDGECLAAW